MKPHYIVLMLIMLLTLSACNGSDENEDSQNTNGDPVADAEKAMVAMFSGEAYTEYFCPEVQSELGTDTAAASGGGLGGVSTYTADCTQASDTQVQCRVTFTIGTGVATPVGTYTIAVKDRQLCGVPTPQ